MTGDASPAGPGTRPPAQVRLAGVLVGVEALAAIGFTVMLLAGAGANGERLGAVIAQGVLFLLLTCGVAAVAVGLVTGRRWARAPGVVIQVLLLPVAYSLIGPSRQVALGLTVGVLAGATLLLLLGQAAKRWAMESFDQAG